MSVAPVPVLAWVVQWMDDPTPPAPQPHHNTPWTRTAERLAEHSGRWGMIARYRPSLQLSKDIRSGRLPSFAKVAEESYGHFETRAHRDFWGTYTVYARFVSNWADPNR